MENDYLLTSIIVDHIFANNATLSIVCFKSDKCLTQYNHETPCPSTEFTSVTAFGPSKMCAQKIKDNFFQISFIL